MDPAKYMGSSAKSCGSIGWNRSGDRNVRNRKEVEYLGKKHIFYKMDVPFGTTPCDGYISKPQNRAGHIFAIWDFPLYLYEKIVKISFEQSYILVLYAKSICLFFLILSANRLYKITYHITNDEKRAIWGSLTYIFP